MMPAAHRRRFISGLPVRDEHRRALTITEVFICIAITALLLGLLLPMIGRMKTAAQQTRCQGNLRQMSIAAHAYAALWNAYPVALRYEQVDGTAHRVAWDWITTFSGQLIGPGPLWQFTDDPDRVMQCPGYHGPSNFAGDPHTGYNYNTDYIGGEAVAPAFGWDVVRRGVAPHACRSASDTALFGVGGFSGGANKFMRAPLNPHDVSPWVAYSGGQALLYSGATNVAWLDGHVKSMTMLHEGRDATDELLAQLGSPRNGFISDDDRAYDPRNAFTLAGSEP